MNATLTDYAKELIVAGKFDDEMQALPGDLSVRIYNVRDDARGRPVITLDFDLVEHGTHEPLMHIGRVALRPGDQAVFENGRGVPLAQFPLSMGKLADLRYERMDPQRFAIEEKDGKVYPRLATHKLHQPGRPTATIQFTEDEDLIAQFARSVQRAAAEQLDEAIMGELETDLGHMGVSDEG